MSDNPTQCTPAPDSKWNCKALESPSVPVFPNPEQEKKMECAQPCCCPPAPNGPGNDSQCLIDLIKEQSKVAKKAETAKAFVDELDVLQKKATAARAEYTQAKYDALLKIWREQDKKIADLIQKVVCAVTCWECLLECRFCTLLNDIRKLERKLNGTDVFPKEVDSLYELYCWHERNRDARKATFDRIRAVLAAWENPAKTLADNLDKNDKLIEGIKPLIATDSAAAVYSLFAKLIPMHWAIRPEGITPVPATSPTTPDTDSSAIKAVYIDICSCDGEQDDSCCGPNTGALSLRHRLIGPQPYLVDPGKFLDIICCLATQRYQPAKDLLATAEGNLASTKDEIERVRKQIKEKTDAIEKDFKAELSTPIDCAKYWKKSSPDDPCTSPPKPCDQSSAC